LHYVLDKWFETEVKPRMRGKATLVRYCDDFIIGFEHEDDALRAMDALGKRLGRFGLSLHADKTRLVPFRRPPEGQRRGKGPATFDFLGFTFYWKHSRSGRWRMGCKTRSARLRRAIQHAYDWSRRHRHQPIEDQPLRATPPRITLLRVSGQPRSLAFEEPHGSCEACHRTPHGDQFDGRSAGCAGCHDLTAFRPASRFDHEAGTRFRLDGAHRDVPCERCHARRSMAGGGERVVYRPLSFACRDCHTGRELRSLGGAS
jgi:hypothetical protein